MQSNHEGASVARGVRCGSMLPDLVGVIVRTSVSFEYVM
jgi:hypothetical protein